MRVFAVSDIHVDYDSNRQWIANLSTSDYRDDVLILAGDVSDSLRLLEWTLSTLVARFKKVLFVPGNHDLWVIRDDKSKTSLEKFAEVCAVVKAARASMQPLRWEDVSIVPLLSWYDYSFGQPTQELRDMWMDFRACRWPLNFEADTIAAHFAGLNELPAYSDATTTITFSHFLPRIDVMPKFIPKDKQLLYPILGGARLETQLRALNPDIHVYGHSHVNRQVRLNGITYINNAFGYPQETWIASKQLLCIYER